MLSVVFFYHSFSSINLLQLNIIIYDKAIDSYLAMQKRFMLPL